MGLVIALGTLGGVLLLAGLRLLFLRPVEGVDNPKTVPILLLGASVALFGVAAWGAKNPKALRRVLRPGATDCPLILNARELQQLVGDQAVSFRGRAVEGHCVYALEFRSGLRLDARVDRDFQANAAYWTNVCGNHPVTGQSHEVWARKLPDEKQVVCFLTQTFQGGVWLRPDDAVLPWIRTLQTSLGDLE